jgi:hypothetical protein
MIRKISIHLAYRVGIHTIIGERQRCLFLTQDKALKTNQLQKKETNVFYSSVSCFFC